MEAISGVVKNTSLINYIIQFSDKYYFIKYYNFDDINIIMNFINHKYGNFKNVFRILKHIK